jgi:hypothetical protein
LHNFFPASLIAVYSCNAAAIAFITDYFRNENNTEKSANNYLQILI